MSNAAGILALQEAAAKEPNAIGSTRLGAAATLLECHVATGISLEMFGDVGTFVNHCLEEVGAERYVPNGV